MREALSYILEQAPYFVMDLWNQFAVQPLWIALVEHLEGRESKKEKGIGIFHIHEEVREG